jgi:hypothetical protein
MKNKLKSKAFVRFADRYWRVERWSRDRHGMSLMFVDFDEPGPIYLSDESAAHMIEQGHIEVVPLAKLPPRRPQNVPRPLT